MPFDASLSHDELVKYYTDEAFDTTKYADEIEAEAPRIAAALEAIYKAHLNNINFDMLEKTAVSIYTAQDIAFNFRYVLAQGYAPTPDRGSYAYVGDDAACGTSGCAVGHYYLMYEPDAIDHGADLFQKYFEQSGLPAMEMMWLFSPSSCSSDAGRLGHGASGPRVARRLLRFIHGVKQQMS